MPYCEHCHISIRDNETCPLCQNTAKTEDEPLEMVFPIIPLTNEKYTALRIMIFISIVGIVLSFAIYKLVPTEVNWPLLVSLGLLSMWLSLTIIIQKRFNIAKNIVWQVAIVSALSIFWDWNIGWMGWSLEFIIPITCVIAMFMMYVTAKVMKLSARDYIIYLLLNALFGIVPLLFIALNWIKVIYPSVICISMSIIFLSAIFIFQGKYISIELKKKMHL